LEQYKLFVQRLGVIGIANILIGIAPIILLAILTKNYSIDEYGIWIQVYTLMNLISIIATLGLPSSMIRFLANERDKNNIKEIFYSLFAVIIFTSLVISLVFLFFYKQISIIFLDGDICIGIILPAILILNSLNSFLVNFFRTFQDIKKYSALSVLQTFLIVIIVLYFSLNHYNFFFSIFGIFLALFINFLVLFMIIYYNIGFKVPKLKNLRKYLSFGLPLIPTNLSSWTLDVSDRLIIGILLGTAAVGYYSPGYSLGNIVLMLVMPFSILLFPLLTKNYENGKIEEVKKYLFYSMKYYLLLAIPTVIGISLLSEPLITIISTPEVAQEGFLITPFSAISGMLAGIYAIMLQVLLLKKKTRITGIFWIASAIINITFNILVIPYLGILGAAIITLISYMIVVIPVSKYYLRFNSIDFRFIIKCLISSVLMCFIIICIKPTNIFNILITITLCSISYFLIIIILKGVTKEELSFFRDILRLN